MSSGRFSCACRSIRFVAVAFFVSVFCSPALSQFRVLYEEGFNTDGDGDRYTMTGRGNDPVGSAGPAMWEHNFNVDVVGLPATAPERRAAILWTAELEELDFTENSLAIWDNLVGYMLNGKEAATIGFVPDTVSPSADFLSFRFEEAGHTAVEMGTDLTAAPDVDLVIHTNTANVEPPTAFVEYATPVISFNGGNHDDLLVSSIGSATAGGPTMVSINDSNKDHPVLGGAFADDIQWIDDFAEFTPLQGVGGAVPAGSATLATYVDPDTELTLPALLIVEKDDPMLGAFAPVPEGAGFIVGGDLNEPSFPEDDSSFVDGANPRTLTLNPIDVSGETGVKLRVGLAATTVDFEDADFLRVSIANDEASDFVALAEFRGLDDASSPSHKSLVDPTFGALTADEFTDFEFDVPDEATSLVVRFEAFSTFPNEVLGIDNVRLTVGEPGSPLDCNGDGTVDAADLDCSNAAGTTNDLIAELNLVPGDLDGDGSVAFPDFLVLSANFGSDLSKYTEGNIDGAGGVGFPDFLVLSANFGSTAAAAAVPEPSGFSLMLLSCLAFLAGRRRN